VRFLFPFLLALSACAVFAADAPSSRIVVLADAKTGRLMRTAVVEQKPNAQRAGQPKTASSVSDLEELVDRIATRQGVEVPLVHSVIRAESNYNPGAVSPKGAQGIMQLIPATSRRFGVSDAFNAEENVEGGVKYLRSLLDYYQGDYARAIAAYNAGEAAVDKYHGIPPYMETENYVSRVARNLKTARLKRIKESVKVEDAPSRPETSRPIQASIGSDGLIYYRTP
jgi:soluble lytic murein transglycosylase-like protein